MWSSVLPPDPDSRQPSSRCKHAMCLYRGNIYMYGGRDGNRSLKDLWQYNLGSGKWTEIRAKGDRPGCLEEHSLVAYKGALFAFGGEFGFASVGEIPLWMLNLETNIWEKPQINSEVANPSGRRGHTSVICNDSMHIYGGYIDLKGSNSEFWTYNFAKNCWHLNYNQQMMPDGPGPRHCHSAVVYDQAMWIYGGMNDLNPRGDFWKWNFQFKRWSRIRSKPSPPELQGHSACKVSDGILLFGGEANGDLSNEIWKFQFRTQTWFKIQVQGAQAPGRTRHVSLLVTSLHLSLIEGTPHNSPKPTIRDSSNLKLPSVETTERSHSAPYLKKTGEMAGTDLENRPYSSPPVIPPDSPTHKRFKNKIQPNKRNVEKSEDSDSRNRVKGWEINREQFVARLADGKDTCKDPMIEMTELVPLIRPKMTHSSTFDSCESIRGFENMGYRKSSSGSLMSNTLGDSQSNVMSAKNGERCNSLDALKEVVQETNFSSAVLTSSDKSDKRRSLPLENIGNNSEHVCDSSELEKRRNTFRHLVALDKTTDDLSRLNTEESSLNGKDFCFGNIYHGNLIDLSTVIQNPDPHQTFVDLLVSSKNVDIATGQGTHGTMNSVEDHSSTDTSSSNTPTRESSKTPTSGRCTKCSSSRQCDTCTAKLSNWHFSSPSTTFKGNLPGFVKSGSLDSMKQLKLFHRHATHLGSSDESFSHDDVFLEDVESVESVTDDDNDSLSEDVRLIRKTVTKMTRQKSGQNGHSFDLEVASEKVPLIGQGQGSRSDYRSSVAKETTGDKVWRKREQVQRQMTAPPLGYKNYNDIYDNSMSTLFTFGGREQEAQYLSIKPISVWKYTFKEGPKQGYINNSMLKGKPSREYIKIVGRNHKSQRY
ncbi:uncharacterized protein LOC135500542 isoform X2 [Lineus longissimus]|uniref:uncharacterized protein LOC135500542 isoform X2 n=1 Tax=Lineus longissimus TaxID=88925 RepID=UPI00315DE8B3